MPSPIGHGFLGLAVVLAWLPPRQLTSQLLPVTLILFLAVFADVDLLAGLYMGDLNGLHRQATHSLPVAVSVSVLCWCVLTTIRRKPEPQLLGLFLLASGGHLLADWLGEDGAAPYGIMLFWPFDPGYYISPVTLFPQLHKASVADMFGGHNLGPMLQETGIILLLLFLVWGLAGRRRRAVQA